MSPLDEVWEDLAELDHELYTAEMNAERLGDYGEHDEMAKHWWQRAAELRDEIHDYAAKHGIQIDGDPEPDRQHDREPNEVEDADEDEDEENGR